MKKGEKVLRRIVVIILSLFSFLLISFGTLELGSYIADVSWTPWRPDYEQVDLTQILAKDELSEEILYHGFLLHLKLKKNSPS